MIVGFGFLWSTRHLKVNRQNILLIFGFLKKNQNKILRQELDEKIRQIKKSLEDLGLNAQA